MPNDAWSLVEHLVGPVGPVGPELGCEECFEVLDAYVELELAAGPADAQMPLMRAHLAGCSACRDDHDSLLAFLLADPREPGEPPTPRGA
jgi:hypothetical protein